MSAPTVGISIDIDRLTDAYQSESCDNCIETGAGWGYPDLYRLTIDNESWLTDRFWLLPESVCQLPGTPDTFTITELPEKSQAPARGWVKALRENPLAPASRRFAPPFAGEFTKAGLTAFSCGIKMRDLSHAPHALVWDDRVRVGILMPVREINGYRGATLPVSSDALAMFDRITAASPSTRISKAWELSVALTAVES